MNDRGHLSTTYQPRSAHPPPFEPGLQKLGLGSRRDSYIYVPQAYSPEQPLPLVLLLHGAGGHAHDGLRILLHLADKQSLILVAPASHATTWDIIARRAYGADLALADRSLDYVFRHYAIDPALRGRPRDSARGGDGGGRLVYRRTPRSLNPCAKPGSLIVSNGLH